MPLRSPLLIYTHVPLSEVLRYPMVLWHLTACAEIHRQVSRILRGVSNALAIAEQVTSFDLMMAIVAAGYGIGLAPATLVTAYRPRGVVMRPLAG